MKKIILAIIVLVVACLPFYGNKVVKETIAKRFEVLDSYGLKSKLIKEDKGYLKTKLSYKLEVKDKEKFLQYIQQFSSSQLPLYTQNLIDGVEFGADMSFNNFPLSDKLSVDLYPVKLSDKIMDEIKSEDENIYNFINKILKKKAIFYHIDYGVVNGDFSGFVKDFKEVLVLKNNSSIDLSIEGINFNGKGLLIAPETLRTSIKRFDMQLSKKDENVKITSKGFKTVSNFESDTTYISTIHVKEGSFNYTNKITSEDFKMELDSLTLEGSSNTQGKKAKFFAKADIDTLKIEAAAQKYIFKNFNYDILLNNVDKKSFIQLQQLAKIASSQELTQDEELMAQKNMLEIFANGFDLKIADLSLEKLSTQKDKYIEGFKINALLHVEKDIDFVKKYQTNPSSLANNITFKSNVVFSKDFYGVLNMIYPVDLVLGQYKKEIASKIIFDISLKNSLLMINSKPVK